MPVQHTVAFCQKKAMVLCEAWFADVSWIVFHQDGF